MKYIVGSKYEYNRVRWKYYINEKIQNLPIAYARIKQINQHIIEPSDKY